jgi:hypothetical protein
MIDGYAKFEIKATLTSFKAAYTKFNIPFTILQINYKTQTKVSRKLNLLFFVTKDNFEKKYFLGQNYIFRGTISSDTFIKNDQFITETALIVTHIIATKEYNKI